METIVLRLQLGVWLGVLGFVLAQDQSKYFGSKDDTFHRCQVGDFARVQCGDLTITPEECDALNCCFDQQCYYANEVTVHCLREGQFKVVVSRASTLPPLDLGSVTLLEGPSSGDSCGPFVASPAFEVFQFPVSACGTTVRVEGDYVIYENEMSSNYGVATGPSGSITRDSIFQLSFQCRYHGSAVVYLVAEVNTVPPPLPVAAQGPLRVELRLASGQCDSKGAKGCADADVYSDYYRDADYPVTKVLREPVYVEVRILERTDPSLVLLLEHCWATSTSNPHSLPQWSLLVDGCPYHADPYQTTLVPVDGSSGLPFPTHYKRFIVQMFTFVDPASSVPLNEMVFIHCSTEVCHPTATDRCEQQCSRKQRRSLVPVGKRSTEEKAVVSSKAVILTNPEPLVSGQRLHGEVPQSLLSYGLLGVAACVLLVSTLALAVAFTVHCLRDGQFKVVVSRASTLPPLDLGSVTLLEGPSSGDSCGPFVASPAFEVFQFPVSACGTTVRVEGDYVIYENEMSSNYGVATGPSGSITRDSIFRLSFQCRYHGSAVVYLVAEVNTVPPPLPVAAAGPLHVELRLASGECDSKGAKGCTDADVYSDYYRDADYPVTKVLREPVYVEVRILGRTDPGLILLLEHCWATSTSNPHSLPQWSLLVDGCPYHADPYQTTLVPVDGSSGLPFPTHYKRFIVQMFTFVDPASSVPLNEMVFIHCSTEVCHPTATDRCEQQCSRKQRRSIVPVGKRSTEEKAVVSSKAVILTNPEPPASGQRLQSEGDGDSPQCYYANEVTVHCLRDGQFKVVVSRASTLPPLDLGSVTLLEGPSSGDSCGPFVASPAFEVFQFPVSACGTTVRVEGDYVIYENEMSSNYGVATGPSGSITRDSIFRLSFQCRYHGSAVVYLVAEVNTVPPPLPVAAQGPLHVELRLASGQCDSKGAKGCADADVYSDYYRDADYPVTKVLREPVYVEVRILERTDPSLVLLLEHCWATSTSNPHSLPQWSLLVDGCPYHADPYQTTLVPVDGSSGLPFPTHYKRFMVQMFTFVDPASSVPLNEMVFIHCSTEVCHPTATDRCEQQCSRKQRRSLVPVGKRSTEEKAVVSSKAVILTNPEPLVSGQRLHGEVPQSLLSYGLLGVAACVLLVSTLALAVACTKLSRKEPKDQSKYFGSKDDTFHRCQVGDFARVQCGDPTITPEECEALNCCFDQQCYYANEVTVHCLRDGQFKVVVSRASTLPPLDLGSVTLLEGPSSGDSCGPFVASPAFEVFQFPVSACGTTVRVEGDYVIYENEMSSNYGVATGPSGSITRDSIFRLSFQCRYHGSAVVYLVAEVNTVPPPLPVAAQGPLRVELRLASGQCDSKGAKGCADADVYSDYYRDADYPVTKVLREPVYVEVRVLDRTDPSLVLLLEHCWATSTSNPHSLPQWSLLVDGCPYHADPYRTTLVPVDGSSGLPFPTHYKRFMVQMFTFVDPASSVPLNEMVFIHCSTEVCHPTATDRCEQQCSRKQRRSLVPVGKRSTEEKAVVSSKAVILTNPEPLASGQRLQVPQFLGYSLLGVAACVLLLSTLALAVVCTKPSRMELKV
ncbi:hypothetical protein SKAU_G00241810 [Synaphobranchus kaupii]|uniref:Zona pellucida sperm-binding protein 4 n=1 Tax=Synaphobranchus kaupii TaxID=118154 RepID=A0A9Q1ITF3_SYNKA|nr:hypothetical protein SKAU_G00241810 [Synaphobranchus kaupii]